MENSNEESLEKKTISNKDLYSENMSEKTEDEIIFNNCNDEMEEEFLETEHNEITEIENLNPEQNTKTPGYNPKNKNPLKSTGNTSIPYEANKSRKNKFHSYYSPKFDFARKKRKKQEEEKKADDLFVQALQKSKPELSTNKEFDQKGNTVSTKISDIIYDKYVGHNSIKVNTIDVISKIKDEEVNLKREAKRTKDDSKKIKEMIDRQEDFAKNKQNKLREREKEINEKLNQECIFMPNGINTSSRTPNDFYVSQIEFLAKKEDYINGLHKSLLDEEDKNKKVILTSKASEKLASSKNPNESKEQLYERLHFEKLKNVKEVIEKPKEEKKLSKREVNNLFDKLYKERIVLKENKDKREKEKVLKETNQGDYMSDSSNKVLLSKFLNYYDKKLMEIFNRKDNFQINIDEYKMILMNMGCINPNLQSDEVLIKESFFNILHPKDDKIDTYSLLLFCLAALGIYTGNDESKAFQTLENNKNNNKTKKNNNKINKDKSGKRLSERRSPRQKIKTFNDLIKSSVPNLDMDKYGFSSKIAKNINKKFHTFVKGINESWTGDISKKKQERQEKLETSKGRKKKASSKGKESSKYNIKPQEFNTNIITSKNQIYNSNKKNNIPNTDNKNNTITVNNASNKFDDLYRRLQNKRDNNNIKALKSKKEQEELALCTFQPNIHKLKNNDKNSKNKDKPKNKLNKEQIENNFEKLYQTGIASYIQKKKSIDPDFDDNLDNKINCTFKPVIHQFNNEVFTKNPIKEELQRFEKIGDQKLNALGNKEYEKPMNFYIESKINKEDIVDRVVPERFSYRNSDNERENETALLKVEVNLDENNNTDKIIIYPGDDAKEKTLQFCLKHRLNEEKKNTLLRIIMEKIEDNKKGEKINFEGRKTEQNQIFQETKKTEIEKDINTNVQKENEN